MAAVRVELGDRGYDVTVQHGALEAAADFARRYPAVALVHDEAVTAPAHRLRASIERLGVRTASLAVAGGEACKTLAEVERVLLFLQRERIDRAGAVYALGGGTVGDLASFAASIWLRGVACVQVPTTLLAMVDSSIGGKTGVDLGAIKNAAGTFWQPAAVFSDLDLLQTLPEEQFRSGMAEVLKYGVAMDRDLLDLAAAGASEDVIVRCASLKARVVSADERDGGLRAILNYGHTVGHALEAATGHAILHGMAVAHGMRAAAMIAEAIGHAEPGLVAAQDGVLRRHGLPGPLPQVEVDAVLQAMGQDKKSRDGRVGWVLPRRIGHADIGVEVDPATVRETVRRLLEP